MQAQKHRLLDADPHDVMPMAETWKNMSIAQVAEAVHDEVRLSLYSISDVIMFLFPDFALDDS